MAHPILMGQDVALQILTSLSWSQGSPQLAAFPQGHQQRQGGYLLHAVHGRFQFLFFQAFAVTLKQVRHLLHRPVRFQIHAFYRDAGADKLRRLELRMLLRRLGRPAVEGFQIFVPVLIFWPQYRDPRVSVLPQDIRETARGLDPPRHRDPGRALTLWSLGSFSSIQSMACSEVPQRAT